MYTIWQFNMEIKLIQRMELNDEKRTTAKKLTKSYSTCILYD